MSELATVDLMEGRAPSLVFCPHPLMPARDRRLVFEPPRAGEKLDRYLARVIGALPDPCIVTIGDRQVPRSWWRNVAVKPGVVIGVAAGVAGGDGNGNSNVGRVVLMIAVVVAAAYTGGAAAGAAGWLLVVGCRMWVQSEIERRSRAKRAPTKCRTTAQER